MRRRNEALANQAVSKLSWLKEKKIRLVATQYRTGSGSDRVESHCSRNSSSQQSQEFFEVGVVERLGNDQVATASCSVIGPASGHIVAHVSFDALS